MSEEVIKLKIPDLPRTTTKSEWRIIDRWRRQVQNIMNGKLQGTYIHRMIVEAERYGKLGLLKNL